MAFAVANIYNEGSRPPGFAKYTYKSDTDTRATVEAVGYFNNTDDLQNFAVDDMIEVTGDEGGYTLYVISISSGSVTTGSIAESGPVLAGTTLTLSKAVHNGRTIYLDQAAGSTLTLPAATGTGAKFRVIVSVTVTSNDHAIDCAGTDEFAGIVYQVDTDTSDALVAYPAIAADDFDGISMNGTTTGGLIGDWFDLEDVAAGIWAIKGQTRGNGTVATPIS